MDPTFSNYQQNVSISSSASFYKTEADNRLFIIFENA